MTKVKIPVAEVKQMIQEEYSKKITELKLKNRLRQINEEIQKISSDDTEEGLEEVKAGGQTTTVGPDGISKGKKWAPQFEKKGSHLVEEEEPEGGEITDEIPMDDDSMSNDDSMPGDESLAGDEDLNIDEILAKLADAIETRITTAVDEKMGGEGSEEMPEENPEEEMPTDEMPSEEVPEEEVDETVVNEQDGTSIAQEQKPKNAVPFDNGKVEIPKADQLVSESVKKRMQILSGIVRNPFND